MVTQALRDRLTGRDRSMIERRRLLQEKSDADEGMLKKSRLFLAFDHRY